MRISDWSSDVCSADRGAVQPAIKLRPAFALGLAPALRARIVGIVAGDIDEDAAGEEIAAAVDRGDAAVTASDLTIDDAGEQDGEEEAEKRGPTPVRSEEHTSELQSLMRISYAVFCLKKKKIKSATTRPANVQLDTRNNP